MCKLHTASLALALPTASLNYCWRAALGRVCLLMMGRRGMFEMLFFAEKNSCCAERDLFFI